MIDQLASFAGEYKQLPTLGFTHFQPAQLTTVGKRATLWINELLMDLKDTRDRMAALQRCSAPRVRRGTQASFLELFDGDHEKIIKMDQMICQDMGFSEVVPVSGQTYSRKVDFQVLSVLSGIAQSASKFGGDMRLLSHLKELEEPFEGKQVGSSAMPYKRNPMRCERICSLSRYVIADALNPRDDRVGAVV